MGLYILNNKNEPKLSLWSGFKCLRFPQKLGVKTSDINTLYGYEYLSRSTCFKSSGSCTVLKGWNKLVHSVTLNCSQIIIFFMIFIPSHPWSLQAGYLQFMWLIFGRWQRRLLRKYFMLLCMDKFPWWSSIFVSSDIYIFYDCVSSPLCWYPSIRPTYIWAVIFFSKPFPWIFF